MLIPFNSQHTHSTSYKDIQMITQAELKSKVNYDQETGLFTWKKNNKKAGYDNHRYWSVMIDYKNHMAHRLAWIYVYGYEPKNYIDHINGNRYDNRICNLREATASENLQNQTKPTSRSKTGYLGVFYRKDRNCYIGQVGLNGKYYRTKHYKSALEAHEAYLELKRKLHAYCTI